MVKAPDVIDAVEGAGWVYDRTRGDHRIYKRVGESARVVIAGKPGDDMPEGTLYSVCRTAGVDEATPKRS